MCLAHHVLLVSSFANHHLTLTSCLFFLRSFSLLLRSVPSAPLQPGKTQQAHVCLYNLPAVVSLLSDSTNTKGISLHTLLSIKETILACPARIPDRWCCQQYTHD